MTKKAKAILEKLARTYQFNKYKTESLPKFIKKTWSYGPGKLIAGTMVAGAGVLGAAGYGAYRGVKKAVENK